MTEFFPSLEIIKALKTNPPTPGEIQLLNILSGMDANLKVYYHPYLDNTRHNVIVVINARIGVHLITVSDKDSAQCINDKAHFYHASTKHLSILKSDPQASPFDTVRKLRYYMYDHFPSLADRRLLAELGSIKPCKHIVQTAVFFSNLTFHDLQAIYGTYLTTNKDRYVYKGFTTVWCKDNTPAAIAHQLSSFTRPAGFDTHLQAAFETLLKPSVEQLEQLEAFQLTKEQQIFAEYTPNTTDRIRVSKVKGIAGSGKTFVIAQKAINYYFATNKPVLILTYNITLRRYIRDKITRNAHAQELPECAFDIIHFDGLLYVLHRLLNLQEYLNFSDFPTRDEYYREYIHQLSQYPHKLPKYEIILIDEVQDYCYEWIKFIQDHLLTPQGEMLVCADEKQNIYGREMDKENRLPRIPKSPGKWSTLKQCLRMTTENTDLALAFQQRFLLQYAVDEREPASRQLDLFSQASERLYLYFESENEKTLQQIVDVVSNYIHSRNKSPNDICIMSQQYEILRRIDHLLRSANGEEYTTRTFESQEAYDALCKKFSSPNDKTILKDKLDRIRRDYKVDFNMNCNTIKLSTVHSFKGWEIDTAVLIITTPKIHKNESEDELIYTAITRAKNNLIIINLGNQKYQEFFTQNKLGITSLNP